MDGVSKLIYRKVNIMAEHYFIAYFSGTGGTAKAAKHLAAALEKSGADVTLKEIRDGAAAGNRSEDYLALLFPVYAGSEPAPVRRWLEQLSGVSGKKAAVIAVSGGGEVSPNTASRRGCIKRLKKRGYSVVYEDSVVMPANIFTSTPANAAARLLKALPEKMALIARDISSGREKSLKTKLRDRLFCAIFAVQRAGAKRFGRKYYTTDDCTGCGLCARGCTTGNIRMEGARPVFGKSCCMCLRCAYVCPANAIKPGMMRSAILKQGFDIEEMEKRPADLTQPLPRGIAWKGLREYLEEIEHNDTDA